MSVRTFQFYSMVREILKSSGSTISILTTGSIRRAVSNILLTMKDQGDLSNFAPVSDKPGFIQSLLEWLWEMESQGITPQQVLSQASKNGSSRDRQLAELFKRYQVFLQGNQLTDKDGSLWLAASALQEKPGIMSNYGLFLVLGFDQFSPHQVKLLAEITRCVPHFGVYLSWDANRDLSSLALARLAQTRRVLEEELSLTPEVIDFPDGFPYAIKRLGERIFDPQPVKTVTQLSKDHGDAVRLISAPSRDSEARWALREAKRLVLEGASPDEIAVLSPSPHGYLSSVRAAAYEYGLPVRCEEKLLENPAAAAFANLLRLFPEFPWLETIDSLRSPYSVHLLSPQQVGLIERLSRERPVVRGIDQWLSALQPLESGWSEWGDDYGNRLLAGQLSKGELAVLENCLHQFFKILTPPDSSTVGAYIKWVKEKILGLGLDSYPTDNLPAAIISEAGEDVGEKTSLNFLKICMSRSDDHTVNELKAIQRILQCLVDLEQSTDVHGVPDNLQVTWAKFREELLLLLSAAVISPDHQEPGIYFGHLSIGRGLPVDHLFVLGMGEGEFPSQSPPDIFYSTAERRSSELPLVSMHPAENASLWRQVLGSSGRSLVLLRPWIDDNGAQWLPSPYWSAVQEVLPNLKEVRLPVVEQPEVSTAASKNELITALALSGATQVPGEIRLAWQSAWRAFRVMETRWVWNPPGVYEGCFQSHVLKDEIANRFGSEYRWSCSKLGRAAKCPHIFFAESVLNLDSVQDPVEGIDVLQLGSLVHAVLEQLHRCLSDEGLILNTENQEAVLKLLGEACEQVFNSAPYRYGFRPGILWSFEQKEQRRILENLIRIECGKGSSQPVFSPFLQEVRFGLPKSSLPPLILESSDGSKYKVVGVVDRIDKASDGNLRVIDYKTGSRKFSSYDILRGEALQTALYALAVEPILDVSARIEESCYMHVSTGETSGCIVFDGRALENILMQGAVAAAGAVVTAVKEGRFPSLPAKPGYGSQSCSQNCDFSALCRVSRRSIAKARGYGSNESYS
jgi:ATP-dependent helicase/nuclease subunit B